jgi:UDPglucose 6-dehydrogenase
MRIGIIGTGYVGLVTAVGLAELEHHVIGTDVDTEKIEKASRGVSHIYEPGLEELLRKNLAKKNLSFTTDLDQTIKASDVLFVCVNTPQKEDGSADMCYVEGVSHRIAENLDDYKLIVEKSTVPVRTSLWIKRTIDRYKRKDVAFDVASNPEFLREGSAVQDFLNPDRIIIGVESEKAKKMMLRMYEKFQERCLVTNIDSAELIKHASNSFLAMKISFINLMADLCEKTDADIELVAKGMGLDPRIGSLFLRAGLGYGGSCFPKDVRALIKIGEDLGVNLDLLKEVDEINTMRIQAFVGKVMKALWNLKKKKIAVLGLSFKPLTDDIRNAPSIRIIKELARDGAFLNLYDPKAVAKMRGVVPEEPPKIVYVDTPYDAAAQAHALLVVTEWEEFSQLDLKKLKGLMANPVIVDGRNAFDPEKMRALGFEYYSIGRK